MTANRQYITDLKGERVSVILPIREYEALLEELDDIRLYDGIKASKQEYLPAEEVFRTIEAKRMKSCHTK